MIKAVQNNNNVCELPKATDSLSSRSADDVTLKQYAASSTTNNASTTIAVPVPVAASTATANNDDEDDCVYVSPDEAENGMNTDLLSEDVKLILNDFVSCIQSQYSSIRTQKVLLVERQRLDEQRSVQHKLNVQKSCPSVVK